MPGATRRNKPLKGSVPISDLDEFILSNETDGDILIWDAVDNRFENGKALTGDYTITGSLTVNDIVLNNDLTLTNDITIGNNLTVSGATALNTLTTSGSATLASLAVTGTSVLTGNTTVAGTLSGAGFSFSGAGTITGTLGVTGNASFVNATATGTLGVTGVSTLGSMITTGITLNGDLTGTGHISTSLGVAGNTVAASGLLSGGSGRITGTLTMGVGATESQIIPSVAGLEIQGDVLGGVFDVNMTNAAGSETDIITGDPDGEFQIHIGANLLGDINHDGSNIGFFGTAPAAQTAAYTQTYATASRTHANPTGAQLSITFTTDDPAITPDGSVTIADGDTPTVNELLEYCEELNDQINNLVADVANAKQVLNSVLDDGQTYGLLQ
jgi:hypothetical protein